MFSRSDRRLSRWLLVALDRFEHQFFTLINFDFDDFRLFVEKYTIELIIKQGFLLFVFVSWQPIYWLLLSLVLTFCYFLLAAALHTFCTFILLQLIFFQKLRINPLKDFISFAVFDLSLFIIFLKISFLFCSSNFGHSF